MTDLTLIRHGQAQTGATDEASYDSLSDLGHQQARWLGEHIRDSHGYERVISGAMNRQIQTAQSVGLEVPHSIDPRLNEMDYFGLADSLTQTRGIPFPTTEAEFIAHLPLVLAAWRSGDIVDGLESYDDFTARIQAAVTDAAALGPRTLVVTSTGVISTLASLALDLDVPGKSKLFMSVAHTSLHRFALRGDGLHLTQFAATPHLDHTDRQHARTYA